MKFSGVITNEIIDAKVQGQKSKVKFTEVKTQISRFGTITPVWFHIWWWNEAWYCLGAVPYWFPRSSVKFEGHAEKNRRFRPKIWEIQSRNAQFAGLDTYFFLNLAVGQPSNNMDLSEIEICLGIIMIFSFGICIIRKENKISGRTYICLFVFHFRIYCAWSTLSHEKPSVFLSRSSVVYFHHPFLRQLPGVYFK